MEGDVGAVILSSTDIESRRSSIWTPEVQASLLGPHLPHGPGFPRLSLQERGAAE